MCVLVYMIMCFDFTVISAEGLPSKDANGEIPLSIHLKRVCIMIVVSVVRVQVKVILTAT